MKAYDPHGDLCEFVTVKTFHNTAPLFLLETGDSGGAEGVKIVRIRIRSHINLNFILQQSLTAFGGAPFAQGSLSRYHAFGLLDKSKFTTPSIDTHRTLGSHSGHRCSPCPWLSLRESWREAPERAHCTDSTDKLPTEPLHRFYRQATLRSTAPIPYTKLHSCTNCLHIPLPLPSGGTSPGGRGKGCVET